jgi:EmrB/QacA subfamily drug resistance transporter
MEHLSMKKKIAIMAAVMSVSFATVGDLFSPRERGRWQGLLGATFGLASLIGPTLGGIIVDNYNWSWVFWVFLPFGIVAFVLIYKLYPGASNNEKEPIDYLGSAVLTISIVAILLGFSWANNKYDWLSFEIIGLFSIAILSLISFIYIESKVKSPVIPLFLFKNSVFTISNLVVFFIGAGMFSVIMYVPFIVQGVLGYSATISGLTQLALTISLVVSSGVAGSLITKTGKYKMMSIIGLAIMAIGIYLNTLLTPESSLTTVIINLTVIGLGMGVTFPVFTLTVQNAVKHKYLGVATATSQLFRELGGTIGVAIMGSIMGSMMAEKLKDMEAPQGMMPGAESGGNQSEGTLLEPQVLMNPEKLAEIRSTIPEQMVGYFDQFVLTLQEALSYALNGVFLFSAGLIALTVILTFFLKEIPLRTTNEEEEEEEENPSNVSE